MSHLYQNKYRITSVRLQSWDYGSEGMYFVTICTRDREHYFGKVVHDAMQLNQIGEVAFDEWYKTPEIRPDMNLELGAFQVMPNHIHGIIIIGANEYNNGGIVAGGHGRDAMHRASTMTDDTPKNQFGPQRKNLASILRGYKSAVTTYARKNNLEFGWQSKFHDHIIRSPNDFERISEYIRNNPRNWKDDRFSG